jgi:uncharacterized protein with HEPN domain
MSQHDDKVYLQHISEAIIKIGGYMSNVSKESFLTNDLLIDAVVRNLEIIGEASNRVSEEFTEAHLEISFRPAISMRNQLAHGYDDVDLEVVWSTVTDDLPHLQSQLTELLGN